MHRLINLSTQEVISFQEFNDIYHFTTIIEDYSPYGYAEVQHTEKPNITDIQRLLEGPVTFDGTQYYESWIVEDVTTTMNPTDIELLRQRILDQKLQELAQYRFNRETSPIYLNGMAIQMDRESRNVLMSAFVILSANIVQTIAWKAMNGWIDIDLTIIGPIAYIVTTYIKLVFEQERYHDQTMSDITDIHTLVDYDFTTGWPTTIYNS
jgi:hypothetical protein